MPVKTFNNEYPVIDTDPHFFRVVRYFRSSDYAAWAVGTAAAPGILLAMGKLEWDYMIIFIDPFFLPFFFCIYIKSQSCWTCS
jgi:hypothetical protein